MGWEDGHDRELGDEAQIDICKNDGEGSWSSRSRLFRRERDHDKQGRIGLEPGDRQN